MKRTLVSLIAWLALPLISSAQETQRPPALSELLEDRSGTLTRTAEFWLGKRGGDALFYFPTHDVPATPKDWGYRFDEVTFTSIDGTKLHGWFVPTKAKKPLGTVVFSHGNAGSLGYHLGFGLWFVPAGYNVFFYDYRGFGKSAGKPERLKMNDDVQAAFSYVKTRRDVDAKRLVSFGYSIGGAQSLSSLGDKPVPGVRAVITEGAFSSYQEMANIIAGKFGYNMTSDEGSPRDYVAKIAPLPLLMVHGKDDQVVPISQARSLFAAAKEPKLLWEVPKGTHGDTLYRNQGEYRKKVLAWLARVMK